MLRNAKHIFEYKQIDCAIWWAYSGVRAIGNFQGLEVPAKGVWLGLGFRIRIKSLEVHKCVCMSTQKKEKREQQQQQQQQWWWWWCRVRMIERDVARKFCVRCVLGVYSTQKIGFTSLCPHNIQLFFSVVTLQAPQLRQSAPLLDPDALSHRSIASVYDLLPNISFPVVLFWGAKARAQG